MEETIIRKTKVSFECAICGKKDFSTEKAVRGHQRKECRRIWFNLSKLELNRLREIIREAQFTTPSWFIDTIGIGLLNSLGREFTKPDIEIVL